MWTHDLINMAIFDSDLIKHVGSYLGIFKVISVERWPITQWSGFAVFVHVAKWLKRIPTHASSHIIVLQLYIGRATILQNQASTHIQFFDFNQL